MSRWIFLKLSPTFFPYFSEKQTSERPKCSSSGKKSELKKKKKKNNDPVMGLQLWNLTDLGHSAV